MTPLPACAWCIRCCSTPTGVIELFSVGVGGVGGALLEQVKRQQEWLKKKHIDLRVCGIANSKALLTNVHGLNLGKLAGGAGRGERAV